jgi:hypothetical protein
MAVRIDLLYSVPSSPELGILSILDSGPGLMSTGAGCHAPE